MLDFASSGVPRPREPMFFVPVVVVAIVVALLAIHAVVTFLPIGPQNDVYLELGFIPGRTSISLRPDRLAELIAQSNVDARALDAARLWRVTTAMHPGLKPWTLVTYALLHGSWTHVGLNCVWIFAFGPPVARRFGALRFLLFFAVTAVAGALAHWAVSPMDFAPLIGASAADSGLMAAAARFMFQRGAALGAERRLGSRTPITPDEAPAATLRQVFTDRRALIFIGIWLATNVVFGAGAQTLGFSEGPVAWVAHIGGFVAGLVLFPLFDRVGKLL